MPDDGDYLNAKMVKLLAEKESLEKQREVLQEQGRKLAADYARLGIFEKKIG